MQTREQEIDPKIAQDLQELVIRLTSAFLGIIGNKLKVINEIFFLKSLFPVLKIRDSRLPSEHLFDERVMSTEISPYSKNKELVNEIKDFINGLFYIILRPTTARSFALEFKLSSFETLTKRFGIELDHDRILKVYFSEKIAQQLITQNMNELNVNDLIEEMKPYCQRNNFPLQQVRFNVGSHSLLQSVTFLHLAIVLGNAELVKSFVDAPNDAWNYIPSTIWHPSSNTALHYCTLYAPKGNASADDPKVKPFILIAHYLTNPQRADHLEINIHEVLNKKQCHWDGGTPLTGAAMNGSVALAKLLVENSPHANSQCWLIGRNDTLSPFDLATAEIDAYFRTLPGHPPGLMKKRSIAAAPPLPKQGLNVPLIGQTAGPSIIGTFFAKPPAPPQPTEVTVQPTLAERTASTFLQFDQRSIRPPVPSAPTVPAAAEGVTEKRKSKQPEKEKKRKSTTESETNLEEAQAAIALKTLKAAQNRPCLS